MGMWSLDVCLSHILSIKIFAFLQHVTIIAQFKVVSHMWKLRHTVYGWQHLSLTVWLFLNSQSYWASFVCIHPPFSLHISPWGPIADLHSGTSAILYHMFNALGCYVPSGDGTVSLCWPLGKSHIMDSHGLCHWYSQPTPESYVIDTPADVGQHLDSYIFDMSANTSWAKDLWCIQWAIQCPVVWHSDRPVCMGVYCWTRKLCSVAFQWYNMHPCTLCRP